jgi:hypothetical protein
MERLAEKIGRGDPLTPADVGFLHDSMKELCCDCPTAGVGMYSTMMVLAKTGVL